MTATSPTDGLRAIPPSMNAEIVAAVDARLADVEREHGAKILLAIESGSRAWGFPSPDSDYDCRFVYVRPQRDYTSLFPKRDVIETPLTEIFDVNGWDLAKALKLLMAGNAVIVEWLTSPIVYRGDARFRADFLALAETCADRNRIARHYLHLGRSIYHERIGDLEDMPVKKLFYALRPAIALRYMRLNPQTRLPPMNFQTLCQGADLAPPLVAMIDELLAQKAVTREMGRGAMPQMIRTTILAEFDAAEDAFEAATGDREDEAARIDAFFQHCLDCYAPTPAAPALA